MQDLVKWHTKKSQESTLPDQRAQKHVTLEGDYRTWVSTLHEI